MNATKVMSPVKIVFLDTETTGLDPKKHGIIQIAGAVTREVGGEISVIERFNYKLKPHESDEIDPQALGVTGTSLTMIELYDDPRKVHREFLSLLGRHCNKFDKMDKMMFSGYNAAFDYAMMREWFLKCDDKYFGSWFWNPPIDVMNMAITRLYRDRARLPNFKLSTLAEFFNIVPDGNFHDAQADIDVTIKLFEKIL